MLYLAEVQKQKTGFMGTAKAELKLLACQRADQSWNPVPGEEVISASLEEANKLSDGALVLADLNPANRQVQRIQEAGRPLVGILQNFSRQLEKSKSQEEEIEQWKQSLTFQSQELNRREMEMEARLEQLQQVEEDFERLEAQRQEIDVGRETSKQLREEIERNRQELEGAWEHLRGEQRRLEERHTEFQPTAVLDEATEQQIQELLSRLSSSVAPTEVVRDQLQISFELVSAQQSILDQYWQQMEQQRDFAQQQQGEVDRQSLLLQNRKSDWQQAQSSLEQARANLQMQTLTLTSKQESAQILSSQLHNQEELYQQVYRLAETSSNASHKVDQEALEKMPLDQLQQVAQDLQRDLARVSQFVHDQEEELRLQHQTIEELQVRLSQTVEHERQNLETELAEQQDCYQMLNETLVGQRRNLQEREEILNQHQNVLRQRQGGAPEHGQEYKNVDPALKPILVQMEGYKQQQAEELQELERQIEQMQSSIQQSQGTVERQSHEQEMQRQEMQNLEQNLLSLQAMTLEAWSRVNLYQELQPVQDSLNRLRQALEAIASPLAQVQEVGDHQLQTIAQLQQTFLSLIPNQELAAS